MVARRQTASQERLTKIEEARRRMLAVTRARPRASTSSAEPSSVTSGCRTDGWCLRNEGLALASAVVAEASAGPKVPQVRGLYDRLPVDLQPGQEVTFLISMVMGDEPELAIVIGWRDAAGEHQVPYMLYVFA